MTRMLWRKLARDLKTIWPRLALMVVAITVSLTTFGAVLLAWSGAARETGTAYASTEPASATILLDTPLSAANLTTIAETVRTRPGILAATARTQFHSNASINGYQTKIPLQIFVAAPDDPMRIAKMFPQSRSWPPGPGVFVAGMSLASSTTAIAEEQQQQRTWDIDVQLDPPLPLGKGREVLARVPGVAAVEDFSSVPAGLAGPERIPITRTYPDQGHGRVFVTAVPDTATTFVPPKLTEGRWLRPGETGALVLNQITRANTVPDLKAGQTVQLIIAGKTTTWRVAGIAEERMGGAAVYATTAGLAEALGRPVQANQLRVVTSAHDEPAREATALAVAEALAHQGFDASAESVSRRQSISEGHLGPVILILLSIALPLGVVGLIGLASTMSANVLDRIREFGVMHAVGARPKTVRRIVAAEGIFLTVISCLLAIAPALVLTGVLGAGLGNLFFSAPLPYRISVAAAAIWPAIAILGALLAVEAAASRAARLTVREALSYL